MTDRRVILISGTRAGLGQALAVHYLAAGWRVVGCSRGPASIDQPGYSHHRLDVGDEAGACSMFAAIRRDEGRLDALVNNAGIASMNHALTSPMATLRGLFRTNVEGTFLLCREAAKLLRSGQIRAGDAGRVGRLT